MEAVIKRKEDEAERLILGSDSPYGDNNINKAINKLRDLNMSVAEINMICSENIEKILM